MKKGKFITKFIILLLFTLSCSDGGSTQSVEDVGDGDNIDPINFTPYNSAHVDEPRTLLNPFDTPINPRKKNEEIGDWK